MKIVNFLRTRAEKEKNLRDFTLFEDFITISFIEKYSALIFISTVNSDVLSPTLIRDFAVIVPFIRPLFMRAVPFITISSLIEKYSTLIFTVNFDVL